MTRLLCWLLLLTVLGGFGFVAYRSLNAQARAGKGMPRYSVYSEEADGLGGAYRFLRNLGWKPVAVTRPVQHTRYRGLLVLVEPEETGGGLFDRSQVSEPDARGLLGWVEEGNTLLLCGRSAGPLHQELDVGMAGDREAARARTLNQATPAEAGGYTDGVGEVEVEGHDTLEVRHALPLWWLGHQPGAAVVRRGRGRVVVVADPSLLTPRGLHRADNAIFLYNVASLHARNGFVYFDEYHHGLRSGGGFWAYLRYHDRQWVIPQLLVVVGVAVWAVAVRLGRAVRRVQTPHADSVDYASAVARIYQRAGARHLLTQALTRDFLDGLTRRLRLRRTALPAEILAAWRRQHGAQAGAATVGHDAPSHAERLEALLRMVTELRKGTASERQLLLCARAFDEFKLEVTSVR